MNIRPGIIILIVGVFAVLLGGQFLGWFGGKGVPGAQRQDPERASDPTRVATSTPPPTEAVSQPQAATPVRPPGRGVIVPPSAQPAAATTIPDWEERIDGVLTSEGEENLKARQLLELLPILPEEGQVEAAQHISNLLPDEEYSSLAPVLTNPSTPEEVLDVLMTDVLNRPNGLKLETLLGVARTPNHPKGEEALDVLEVYVDENFGSDWAAWDAAVKKWLAENPDE